MGIHLISDARPHDARQRLDTRPAWLITAAAIALTAAQNAAAQTTPGNEDTEVADGGEIIVTGSQVTRKGFISSSPTSTVTSEDLEISAATNIAEALNELPNLKASTTPSTMTNTSALAGGNYLDLRGLGIMRTLTLVDSKRYVPTLPTNVVNTNLIPQAIIGGVDVVTGGASAAYGSDAVAGVVNLRFDSRLERIKGSAQAGITDHGDYRNFLLSLGYGKTFADGRGRILIGVDGTQNSGIPFMSARNWRRSVINNPAWVSGNGEPQYLIVSDPRASNVAPGGVINSPGLLRGIQFDESGNPVPFKYGTLVTNTGMSGGDGMSLIDEFNMVTPVSRYSGLVHLSYEVLPDVSAYLTTSYGRMNAHQTTVVGSDQITIRQDNAFLPESIRQTMIDNSINSFVMGRTANDYARGEWQKFQDTLQVTTGLKGSLGGSWSFDASYGYGQTRHKMDYPNERITANFALAVDAVADPVTGAAVCRSTLANPTNGCVPINLFGYGAPSDSAINYVTETAWRRERIEQHVVDFVVRGTPLSIWAGDVSLAVGAQWRRQSLDVRSDPVGRVFGHRVHNNSAFSGQVSVKEAFGEVVVPLAQDESWAKSLELNLAGRVTDYSTSGTVVTWKGGLSYAVSDTLRLRATRSRDIRAPHMEDLFQTGRSATTNITDPELTEFYLINSQYRGNPNVKPETANTLTAGIVFTPTFARGLSASIDFYDIKIDGVIATLGAQGIINRCYTDTPSVCSLIERGSDGRISGVWLAPANFQQLHSRGVDVEMAYRIPVGRGRIDLHGMVSYHDKLALTNENGIVTNYIGNTYSAGSPGGSPRWRFRARAGYSQDGYRLTLTSRFTTGGDMVEAYEAYNGAQVPSVAYFDLSGEMPLFKSDSGRNASLFGVITNLLDKDPPASGAGGYGVPRMGYDMIGRRYTLGVRFKM